MRTRPSFGEGCLDKVRGQGGVLELESKFRLELSSGAEYFKGNRETNAARRQKDTGVVWTRGSAEKNETRFSNKYIQ